MANGNHQARLPNTSNISFTGTRFRAALILLDQHGICCSAGSACRTGSLEGSHVLRAMKLSDERARSNVRFSFGRFNTEADVDKALEIVPKVSCEIAHRFARGASQFGTNARLASGRNEAALPV